MWRSSSKFSISLPNDQIQYYLRVFAQLYIVKMKNIRTIVFGEHLTILVVRKKYELAEFNVFIDEKMKG